MSRSYGADKSVTNYLVLRTPYSAEATGNLKSGQLTKGKGGPKDETAKPALP